VSHCFALNGSAADPRCGGVKEILDTYGKCLPSIQVCILLLMCMYVSSSSYVCLDTCGKCVPNIQLWGPTNFADVITVAANQARRAAANEYVVYN